MSLGYVKLWRKAADSGLFQMPNTLALFMYMLIKATHKPIKHGMEDLQPGQFVSGRKALSKELKQSEQEIRTSLEKLVTLQILTIKSTNKYSIYTIVNYGKYQMSEDTSTINLTNKQPTNNQQATTKQEGKKERIDECDKFSAMQYLKDNGVDDVLAKEVVAYRKSVKAANSKIALDRIKSEAEKASVSMSQALTWMIERSWKSFAYEWIKGKPEFQTKPKGRPDWKDLVC